MEDQDSFNGTFVNGTRVRSAVLRPGDVLSVLWMQVIMGVGFVSINDGGRNIAVRSSALQRVGLPSETGCAARPAPGMQPEPSTACRGAGAPFLRRRFPSRGRRPL